MMIFKIFGKRKEKEGTFVRIFFATDVHGSDKVFRKFVAAGKFYKANVLILGGDITGKFCVPIMELPDGRFQFNFSDVDRIVKREELEMWEKAICDAGAYPFRADQKMIEELKADKKKLDKLFTQLMVERLNKWIEIAEQNLKAAGISCYITGGNDDPLEVIEVLRSSEYVVEPEGMCIRIDEHHEMISMGYSNISPWGCPRDLPEDELAKKIDEMVSQVENIKSCIFNLHPPPFSSGLDNCPRLDTSVFPPRPLGGEFLPAGSTAVRKAIEEYQPLLGLHGHIHESRGAVKIGQTLCINPGSEYGEGILRGAIINLDEKGIRSYQLTAG